ncbi:hypothetical protein GQ53DRAFT_148374 [Thozetella sp. PMI_491]|nr:hypothetical protein GQ53DRAFT_148374 [Thozetella sp. PMI_491]
MIMNDVATVFTGSDLPILTKTPHGIPTAVSDNGICIFLEALVSISPRADILRRIHVIPGYIQRESRRYDSVRDPTFGANISLDNLEFETRVGALDGEDPDQDEPPEVGNMTPLVGEPGDAGQLVFFYRVATSRDSTIVFPGWVTDIVLKNTGRIFCERARCEKEIDTSVTLRITKRGWKLPTKSSRHPFFYDWKHTRNSEVARIVALATLRLGGLEGIRMRRDECINCCLLACTTWRAYAKENGLPAGKSFHII